MEERKLNFNAPLLSVRRFSLTRARCSDRDKQKINKNCPPTKRHTLPFYNSDNCLEQVTEPVAVPFVWEQMPGKAKCDIENDFQPNMEASGGTPRLPPGRVLDAIKYPVEKDFENQNVIRHQTETYSMNDNMAKLDCSNEGMNEKCMVESENDDDDDVYSDALDTLSPTDSFSMNGSVSDLSGSGGLVAKPSGTFSTDPQTRDFMMSRFLPAAKAMTLETPQYASRKQSMAPEQPREVKKVVVKDRTPLVNQYESIVIPHYNQDVDVDEEETEDEYDDYEDSGNLSRKSCGLLPQLCFKNSLCLLNPVPGLRVTNSPKSSTREGKTGKATHLKSQSQILEKHAWDAVHKNKSDTKVQFPRLPGNKSNGAVQSPRLPGNKSDIGVQSSQLPEIEKMLTCRSNQFTTSGEQLIVNTSPPKKLPGSSRISPYRRERPQSPFRGGGFLGMPKEAAKFKANMSVRCTRSNNSSQELVPYQSTKQGSGPLSPAAEKTLYVDTVNFVEVASSDSNSSDTKVQTDHIGKHSDNRMLGNPACVESSLHGRKGLNLMDGKGISEYEITGSVNSSQSSFYDKMEDWMKSQGQQAEMDCFRENGGLNQESKSLQRIKVRAEGNLTFSDDDDDDSKAADQGIDKAGSDYSPLPPPLPKTPSESWLWRALPSATSRNSFPQSYVGTRFNPKNQEPKIPATDTKWETIVKTSYLHHDHVRYSEELVTHFSQQSKT